MSPTLAKTTDDRRAAEITGDARWFPMGLDLRDETFTFVRTDDAMLSEVPFASRARWDVERLPTVHLSIAATLANWPDGAPPPTNFVWHTGFCNSTLLTRALDRKGRNLSLREPDVLATLGDVKRARLFGEQKYRRLPQAVFGLLSRPPAGGSQVLIKVTPSSAILISDAAQLTSGKMLFLYTDCARFLIGVARGGETRRALVRRTFANIAGDGHKQSTWSANRLFGMSDLQIAALVWHMLMTQYQRSMSSLGARAASLDCDALVHAPAGTLSKLDQFFGLGLGPEHIDETMRSPLFRRHAKTGDAVDGPVEQWTRDGHADGQLAEDIGKIVAWSYEACEAQPGRPLSNPLVEVEKSYP